MNGNSPRFNQEMKRNSTIFLMAVIVVNVGYWGWRWATYESYEDCLKAAAKASNGVHRAYADLRGICEDREFERMIAKAPPPKLPASSASEFLDSPKSEASQKGLFDDLIPAKK